MARARNIKPGFFRNADLVELPYEARLLFIGLWTIADRSGRLEDRPKQIKMELFPADSIDCDALLSMLQSIKMIERYEHGGSRFIQVVNFDKHQNPHRDEKASTLPDRNGHIAEQAKAPCKHSANTLQDGTNKMAIGLIPSSLIPDPLLLIPDPLPDGGSEHKLPTASAAPPQRKRGSKVVPQDFEVTIEMRDWARASHPGVDLQVQTAAFRDHEFKDAKTDWVKAWRNWIRRSDSMPGASRPGLLPNRQEAIEARNAAAGDEWLRQQGIEA